MNELEEAWSEKLALAIENAKSSGRGDIADYLALKQSNDAIRQTGVEWLFGSFIEIASEAGRHNPMILIEREEPHEFEFNRARMAGSLLRIRFGVRSLSVEAGWTRTPAHGFMRGGALAAARVTHFGRSKNDIELTLVQRSQIPGWLTISGSEFVSRHVREHFEILLD
jgi:hypothetical protein